MKRKIRKIIIIIKYLINFLLKILRRITEKIILPGFAGHSLFYVGSFFIKGLLKGAVSIRASSVAFNMILSLFPMLIFIFSLIPFIPIDNFQIELFNILEDILPEQAYMLFYETISDTIMNQRVSTLSISIFMMLFFSSNGIIALIEAFNNTYHQFETRNIFSIRIMSVVLVLMLSLLLILAIALIILGNNFFVDFFSEHPLLLSINFPYYFVAFIRWSLILALFFIAISTLYYLAPAKRDNFHFISPGSIFATFFLILSIYVFTFYVNNLAQYNKLYGSLGTIIVVMLLFYIAALVLILGFELNVSIGYVDKTIQNEKSNN